MILAPGDVIIHSKFKRGTVVSVARDGIAKIDFDAFGEKSLSIAPPFDRNIRRATASHETRAGSLKRRISNIDSTGKPKVWWVNQGETYSVSRDLGCIWAPLRSSDDKPIWHWETVGEVSEGDIIVHYNNGEIRALGRATSEAHEAAPPAGHSGWTRHHRGRRVEVDYFELVPAIPLDDVVRRRISALNIEQGPLDRNENVKQCYLLRFSARGLEVLRKAFSGPWPQWAETTLR